MIYRPDAPHVCHPPAQDADANLDGAIGLKPRKGMVWQCVCGETWVCSKWEERQVPDGPFMTTLGWERETWLQRFLRRRRIKKMLDTRKPFQTYR